MTRFVGRLAAGSRQLGQRDLELALHGLLCLSGFTFFELLADAQDGSQVVLDAAQQFAADQLVSFLLVTPPLAVPDDAPRGQAGQHGRRDLTRICAEHFRVDVLSADLHAAAGQGPGQPPRGTRTADTPRA